MDFTVFLYYRSPFRFGILIFYEQSYLMLTVKNKQYILCIVYIYSIRGFYETTHQ